jgi:hypothetical protein
MESITRLTAGLVVFSMPVSFEELDGNWTMSIDTILTSDLFPIAIGILTSNF